MLRRLALLPLSLAILALNAPTALALDFSLLGGMNLTTSTLTSAAQESLDELDGTQTAGLGYSAGAFLSQDLILLEVEGGLVYSHSKISQNFDASDERASISFNYFQIPVVARFHVFPGLSLGGGVYYAHSVGSVSVSSNVPGVSTGNQSFADSQTSTSDFGILLNARAAIPIGPGMSAVADFRYLFGLTNLSTDNDPEDDSYLRELQFMVGLSLSL